MTTVNDSRIADHVDQLCQRARPAGQLLVTTSSEQREAGLLAAADAIAADEAAILAANAQDMAAADGLSSSLRDRLQLSSVRVHKIVSDLRAVAGQRDPIGTVLEARELNQGLQLQKVRVPIGVIAIIFESRPNVTVDAAALCIRSGNACILRGGKEAVHSNRAFAPLLPAVWRMPVCRPTRYNLVQEQDRALIQCCCNAMTPLIWWCHAAVSV